MPEMTLSVKGLVDIPAGGFQGRLLQDGISGEGLSLLQTAVTRAAPSMHLNDLEAGVCDKLSELLDIEPIKFFAGAWEKYELLSNAAKESKSGDAVFVELAGYPVTSQMHPYVEIHVGPKAWTINFDVTFSLTLKGVRVKVQSAEIRGIGAGSVEGSVEVAVEGCATPLWKHDIKPIPLLSDAIKFGSGIPIR
jgi:hypothetical protein